MDFTQVEHSVPGMSWEKVTIREFWKNADVRIVFLPQEPRNVLKHDGTDSPMVAGLTVVRSFVSMSRMCLACLKIGKLEWSGRCAALAC